MKKDTDLIISLISRIREKANTHIVSELKRHQINGLQPVHGDIIYALMNHRELSMKQIAEIVDRKKSTVTTLIEKLIRLGFVEKRLNETDNRSFLISLTNKGERQRQAMIDISENLIKKVYKNMPQDERQQLVKALRSINDNW
ncbi:MAG: winged helix-turn-helix transcriptional regulator [Desulfobacterium sp.]|nr:winged helix-turn-helix transcriptional regulator [Desulfobacterium sp.]